MLAMGANENGGSLDKRGVHAFFASRARSYKYMPWDGPEHQPLPRSGFCIF